MGDQLVIFSIGLIQVLRDVFRALCQISRELWNEMGARPEIQKTKFLSHLLLMPSSEGRALPAVVTVSINRDI